MSAKINKKNMKIELYQLMSIKRFSKIMKENYDKTSLPFNLKKMYNLFINDVQLLDYFNKKHTDSLKRSLKDLSINHFDLNNNRFSKFLLKTYISLKKDYETLYDIMNYSKKNVKGLTYNDFYTMYNSDYSLQTLLQIKINIENYFKVLYRIYNGLSFTIYSYEFGSVTKHLGQLFMKKNISLEKYDNDTNTENFYISTKTYAIIFYRILWILDQLNEVDLFLKCIVEKYRLDNMEVIK